MAKVKNASKEKKHENKGVIEFSTFGLIALPFRILGRIFGLGKGS